MVELSGDARAGLEAVVPGGVATGGGSWVAWANCRLVVIWQWEPVLWRSAKKKSRG